MTQLKGLIAIGASTGGPRALKHILSQLPPDFPAAVLVVQHMPYKFTRPFAERLDSICALTVVEAGQHEPVHAGTVYVAPGNRHLTVGKSGNRLQIVLDDAEIISGHRPSVDRLFTSLTSVMPYPLALVLLTGMGKDGARGMQQMKQTYPAVTTLAEDASSCIVFGMPKAAIEAGCVDEVVPLATIADKLKQLVNRWTIEGGVTGE